MNYRLNLETKTFLKITLKTEIDKRNILNREKHCPSFVFCNGQIDCDWMIPDDEANCITHCADTLFSLGSIRCACNPEVIPSEWQNYTCKPNTMYGTRGTCYFESGKLTSVIKEVGAHHTFHCRSFWSAVVSYF